MTPTELIKIIQLQTQSHLKPLKVDVRAHAGKFVWGELTKITYRCPAVFISCLGWKPATDHEIAQLGAAGNAVHRVRFIAGITTKSNKDANARNEEARLIAESLATFMESQDWGQADVLEAQNISCEALFVPAAEDGGQSLWILDWWHVMSFDAASVGSMINEFLTAHGDHYSEPGAYTDAQGNDLVASQDTVTLPQDE